MDEIILVQHCQSEHHINELSGGWTDTPLTELGRTQAKKAGQKLKNEINAREFKLFTSDLLRAFQTAKIMSNCLGLPISVNTNFRERNFGIGTGKTKEWFEQNFLPIPDKGRLDHTPIEGAETIREFNHRIITGLEEVENSKLLKIIIITHGGVIPMVILWWLRLPLEVLENSSFASRVGGITKLQVDFDDRRILSILSDISHLK
ncbi:hypothetical protein LCGC14_0725420 [marine sediment metagenome]|uniref:Histidine phosphatase family protein n=1 Tax=marine sediment metagenome TaxID=412755 RepID=A0A0F9TID1_9ZZZZ|nr:MAG: putative phosphoserine phosphatase 2 [Candidatus Lokiarchaeum sp. GC14_75]